MEFSLNEYLDELRPLIDVDCGTYTVAGIEVIAKQMEAKYLDLGFAVKRIDCGKAGVGLEARNKPEAEGIDLLLIGHMDTVFPEGTVAKRPMTLDDKNAYGPGVADMKGGLLNIVYALRNLDKSAMDKLSICVCMNPDEEVGSLDSTPWLTEVAKTAKQVLVAEPSRVDGSLVKARKGNARYTVRFSGKAAHAGNNPADGRSAISEMAHWVLAINEMTNFDSGLTFNVGTVKGGDGANIVPDHCEIVIDARFWSNDEFEAADAKLHAMVNTPFIDGVSAVVVRESHKPSMTPSQGTEALMAVVNEAGEELGIKINYLEVGGGSDANLTASLGIPTIDGMGPSGGLMHGPDEFLILSSIEERIKLLKRVIEKLAA